MRGVLHLHIFVKEDILEIEFSSFKTTPDVAPGFRSEERRVGKEC